MKRMTKLEKNQINYIEKKEKKRANPLDVNELLHELFTMHVSGR